jgi:hypothetical protein
MTELEILRRRRELVVLSAELQRATIARRMEHLTANPARRIVGFAAKVASTPLIFKLGTAAMGFAVRTYRRRSAAKKLRH